MTWHRPSGHILLNAFQSLLKNCGSCCRYA